MNFIASNFPSNGKATLQLILEMLADARERFLLSDADNRITLNHGGGPCANNRESLTPIYIDSLQLWYLLLSICVRNAAQWSKTTLADLTRS